MDWNQNAMVKGPLLAESGPKPVLLIDKLPLDPSIVRATVGLYGGPAVAATEPETDPG